MFENNFANPYGFNSMPTATQPYGYPMPPYVNNAPTQAPTQMSAPASQPTNTNKIFVNGENDVRNWRLPPNSDYVFLDNDNAIIYQKIVDSKGQFEVKAFDITPHIAQNEQKEQGSINLSDYVLKSDLEPLQSEIKALKDKLEQSKGVETSGRTE